MLERAVAREVREEVGLEVAELPRVAPRFTTARRLIDDFLARRGRPA